MALKRFGVSVPEDLLEKFDKLVEKKGYVGRSEAIRDAMWSIYPSLSGAQNLTRRAQWPV